VQLCLHLGDIGVGVPDLEDGLLRELAHRPAVRRNGRQDGCAAFLRGEAVVPAGHLHARREAFDVPLPGPRKGFVEVVDVEDEAGETAIRP
jgi:hypothetical protein